MIALAILNNPYKHNNTPRKLAIIGSSLTANVLVVITKIPTIIYKIPIINDKQLNNMGQI